MRAACGMHHLGRRGAFAPPRHVAAPHAGPFSDPRHAGCPVRPPHQDPEGTPMRYLLRIATTHLGPAALGLALLACDRAGTLEPDYARSSIQAAARITGTYAGTAVATDRKSIV